MEGITSLICHHHFLHSGGLGDGLPKRFILDLSVTEELVRFRVKKNRVVVDSVFLKDLPTNDRKSVMFEI